LALSRKIGGFTKYRHFPEK
jgi:hypothetical protein